MLLLDTEDLILGTPRLFSAEHFTTLWKEYIRLFDEKAATVTTLQHDGGEALFREVAVCGNCHAVCKKLENLLKTLFVPSSTSETEARLHRQLHAQDDVLLVSPQSKHCQQQQGDLPAHSPPRRDVRPFSGSYYDDRNGNGGRSDREGDVYQNSLQRASRQAQGPRSVQSLEFSENNTDDDADGGTGDNNGDLDSGDDEASILPLYNEVELSRSGADGGQTANSTFSNINDTSSAEYEENIPKINHAQEQQQQQQQSETINTAICETPSRKSSKTRVKLSNFYPNIGSIFPAVYGSQSGK